MPVVEVCVLSAKLICLGVDNFVFSVHSINFNTDTSQKNFNADMTNPNVYQFIDENNSEHVYDEIVQKEAYKDPGESVRN